MVTLVNVSSVLGREGGVQSRRHFPQIESKTGYLKEDRNSVRSPSLNPSTLTSESLMPPYSELSESGSSESSAHTSRTE